MYEKTKIYKVLDNHRKSLLESIDRAEDPSKKYLTALLPHLRLELEATLKAMAALNDDINFGPYNPSGGQPARVAA